MCIGLNVAMAELYLVLGCLFRRFEMQLFEVVEERDIVFRRDWFAGEVGRESRGVRFTARCVDGYRGE